MRILGSKTRGHNGHRQLHRRRLGGSRRNGRRRGERPVDLLDRPSLRLEAEEQEGAPGDEIPGRQVEHRREKPVERRLGADDVRRADDQGEPERADDFAEAADAVGRSHTARPQPGRPHLCRVRTDDRVAEQDRLSLDGLLALWHPSLSN